MTNEPRFCRYVHCRKLIVRKLRGKTLECDAHLARREFCDKRCATLFYHPRKEEPHDPCTICRGPVLRRDDETGQHYRQRKTCGGERCAIEARARGRRASWRRITFRPQTPAQVRSEYQLPSKNTGITDIAEFIAKHGITKCPPAYAFNSTGQISDADRQFHAERYAEIERQRLANVKRRGVSA
jgi:hypothetical protein